MKAGDLVRYVDVDNNERLGIVLDPVGDRGQVSVYPVSEVALLDRLLLNLKAIVSPESNIEAGGPPYWITDGTEFGVSRSITEPTK